MELLREIFQSPLLFARCVFSAIRTRLRQLNQPPVLTPEEEVAQAGQDILNFVIKAAAMVVARRW